MYLQITTRCNMTCAHCCMSAKAAGLDMPREVFSAALETAARYGQHVTLGGGEPTCHKEFFVYLDRAIDYYLRRQIDLAPLVVTNGKRVRAAWRLLDYVDEGRPLWVDLSQDEFHDPIRSDIVAAFRLRQKRQEDRQHAWGWRQPLVEREPEGGAGIRTVRRLLAVGRARTLATHLPVDEGCCCSDPLVDPLGDVYACGCKTHRLGNLLTDGDDFLQAYDYEFAHTGGVARQAA